MHRRTDVSNSSVASTSGERAPEEGDGVLSINSAQKAPGEIDWVEEPATLAEPHLMDELLDGSISVLEPAVATVLESQKITPQLTYIPEAPEPASPTKHGLAPLSRQKTLGEIPIRPQTIPMTEHSPGLKPASLYHTLPSELAYRSDHPDKPPGNFSREKQDRTVTLPALVQPKEHPSIPEAAPAWVHRARKLALELEEVVQTALATPESQALNALSLRVERTAEAFSYGGFEVKEVAAVSSAVRNCYRQLMRPQPDPASQVLGSSQWLEAQLPERVKRWVSQVFLAQTVSELRSQTSERDAMVRGTMKILGWDTNAERSAERWIDFCQNVE